MNTRPAAIPPAKPPNQLMPPRDVSSWNSGASPACSAVQSSLAPSRPPITPAMPTSTTASGSPARRASRRSSQTPASAPSATMTPKLVTSNEPMLNRTG